MLGARISIAKGTRARTFPENHSSFGSSTELGWFFRPNSNSGCHPGGMASSPLLGACVNARSASRRGTDKRASCLEAI
jgi:hypothetical protein